MKKDLEWAIKLMAKGNEKGFNEVYAATYQHVYFRAKALMKEEQDTLDLVQNVYVEAYKSISSLKDSSALFGWFDGIIYRQGMKIFRKKKDVLLTEDETGILDELESNDITGVPELTLDQKETAAIIKNLIEELPELQKLAVISYYYDGYSIQDIARMQDCSEGTIKSRLNYARKSLKEKVEDQEKRENYRLHAFALPTLWFAVHMLSEETATSDAVAQTVYNASCGKVGLKAKAVKIWKGTEEMKKLGLGMKFAGLSTGAKIASVAGTVLVIGGISAGAVMAAHSSDANNNVEPEPVIEAAVAPESTESPVEPESLDSAEAPVATETPAPVEATMWATTTLNVRASASADSEKLGTLSKGDAVITVGDASDGWYTVTYCEKTGFVKADYLSATEVAKTVSFAAKSSSNSSTKASTKSSTKSSTSSSNSSSSTTESSTAASTPAAETPAETSTSAPAASTSEASTPAATSSSSNEDALAAARAQEAKANAEAAANEAVGNVTNGGGGDTPMGYNE